MAARAQPPAAHVELSKQDQRTPRRSMRYTAGTATQADTAVCRTFVGKDEIQRIYSPGRCWSTQSSFVPHLESEKILFRICLDFTTKLICWRDLDKTFGVKQVINLVETDSCYGLLICFGLPVIYHSERPGCYRGFHQQPYQSATPSGASAGLAVARPASPPKVAVSKQGQGVWLEGDASHLVVLKALLQTKTARLNAMTASNQRYPLSIPKLK